MQFTYKLNYFKTLSTYAKLCTLEYLFHIKCHSCMNDVEHIAENKLALFSCFCANRKAYFCF